MGGRGTIINRSVREPIAATEFTFPLLQGLGEPLQASGQMHGRSMPLHQSPSELPLPLPTPAAAAACSRPCPQACSLAAMGAGRRTQTYDVDTRWAAQRESKALLGLPGRARCEPPPASASADATRDSVACRQSCAAALRPPLLPRRNDTNYRFEQQQKNLGAQLGGVIFSERAGRAALWEAACGAWRACSNAH